MFAYGNTVDHVIGMLSPKLLWEVCLIMVTGVVYGAIGLHTKSGRVTPGQLNVYNKVHIPLPN